MNIFFLIIRIYDIKALKMQILIEPLPLRGHSEMEDINLNIIAYAFFHSHYPFIHFHLDENHHSSDMEDFRDQFAICSIPFVIFPGNRSNRNL